MPSRDLCRIVDCLDEYHFCALDNRVGKFDEGCRPAAAIVDYRYGGRPRGLREGGFDITDIHCRNSLGWRAHDDENAFLRNGNREYYLEYGTAYETECRRNVRSCCEKGKLDDVPWHSDGGFCIYPVLVILLCGWRFSCDQIEGLIGHAFSQRNLLFCRPKPTDRTIVCP